MTLSPVSHFTDRLAAAVLAKNTPAMVGLDPRAESLPAGMLSGNSPAEVAAAYETFCKGVVDVVAPLVPVVKPQAAFFEELGAPGCVALANVVQYARAAGLLVVMDGKRNDIGSTAQGYAAAYVGPQSAWQSDALTVSPYLGDDSITPFFAACKDKGGGIFVLVKTSNAGGGLFQDLNCEGKPLYQHVAAYVQKLATQSLSSSGYGMVGAVVGATYPQQLAELRAAMPNVWILIPGYGAQGGTAEDCQSAFNSQGLGAVVNSSRGIIFAHASAKYREKFGSARWQDAVAAATHDMIADFRAARKN